jgi:GAF domain-containing protein
MSDTTGQRSQRGEDLLAATMADVARLLQREESMAGTLDAIVRAAVERLDGMDEAGITLVHRRKPLTPAATSDLPRAVDALQYAAGEGPCLDAITEQGIFVTGDLAGETDRWPDFGPRAAQETGVLSILSFRLFVSGDTLGALNFYSRRRDAFGEEQRSAGSLLAAHAALAMAQTREQEQLGSLRTALDSNRRIGAAVGILMVQHGITQARAFDLLRDASQHANRKLRLIADEVVATGTLPDGLGR